jgi:hypothetical protein
MALMGKIIINSTEQPTDSHAVWQHNIVLERLMIYTKIFRTYFFFLFSFNQNALLSDGFQQCYLCIASSIFDMFQSCYLLNLVTLTLPV